MLIRDKGESEITQILNDLLNPIAVKTEQDQQAISWARDHPENLVV